jgi:hypothetical protein
MTNDIGWANCTQSKSFKLIVVSERGKTAVFENLKFETYEVTKVDGCVKCDGAKVDFSVADCTGRRVLIELKGRDVEHGIEQISNTMVCMRKAGISATNVAALIVCTKVPIAVSRSQRLVAALKKQGVSKVKMKSRQWAGTFDELF